ncbi:MAG TPA: hypothetical protein VH989_10480, partial [Actinomycetota bacterium]
MRTEIAYLDLLEEDLLRAAELEHGLESDRPHKRVEPRRRRNWMGVAAGIAAFLLVAGLIGLIAGSQRNAAKMSAPAAQGTTVPGAGALAGVEPARSPFDSEQNHLGNLFQPSIGQGNQAGPSKSGDDLTKIIRKGELSITVPRDGIGNAV